jgi:hypothetical protein
MSRQCCSLFAAAALMAGLPAAIRAQSAELISQGALIVRLGTDTMAATLAPKGGGERLDLRRFRGAGGNLVGANRRSTLAFGGDSATIETTTDSVVSRRGSAKALVVPFEVIEPASRGGPEDAAGTITAADVRTRIAVLADDSMRGRGTPSPELEQAAEWIAAEFRRLGLSPRGDGGTFFQRYAIRRWQLDSAASVTIQGPGTRGQWRIGREAYVGIRPGLPEAPIGGPLVLVVGEPPDTARPFGDVPVRGAIVLHIPTGPLNVMRTRGTLAAGIRGWITANGRFAALAPGALAPRLEVAAPPPAAPPVPIIAIADSAIAQILAGAGLHLDTLRAGPPVVRLLDGFTAVIDLPRLTHPDASAPNVIGVLEGSDPVLKREYVFVTAHLDHIGVAGAGNGCNARGGADSICNGADDDASGTAGVLELAEAFASLDPRPRRSLVFMTVSGEERGLWGSQYYVEHPTLPLANTVADINLDMIGRNDGDRASWRDTIAVIGKEHSTLGEAVNRVARAHPELGLAPVDDPWPEQNFYQRSDHFNFARKGVPILFFLDGTHPDYHRPTDTVDKIDADKEARILRMVFHLGLEVANATERPAWNPESRRRFVEGTPQ